MGKFTGNTIGFLERLRKDVRGNAMMLVAAALLPLLGLIGGGVDLSRIYLTKSRLQQACDAGVLAGRKAMAGGAWSQNNGAPNTAALAMFDVNFVDGAYGSESRTRAFAENAGTVTGTTSVVLPMAIMKVFGVASKTIPITCQAEMRIPNSDVMFVLDNTGSMAWCPDGSDCDSGPGSKIVGLRSAVRCFYEALAKVDSEEDCGSTPSASNASGVQLRFGFVPYAVNVQVGRILRNDWIVDRHTYQSRIPVLKATPSVVATAGHGYSDWSGYSTYGTYTNVTSESNCDAHAASFSSHTATGTESARFNEKFTGRSDAFASNTLVDFDVTIAAQEREAIRESYNGKKDTCVVKSRTRAYTQTRTYSFFNYYTYRPVELNVAALKTGGTTWANTISLPWGTRGTYADTTWNGCIEERQSFVIDSDPSNDYTPIPTSAFDMDIDMVPTTNAATRWKPQLPDVVWGRTSGGNRTYANVNTASERSRNYSYDCPVAPARTLQEYPTATGFDAYVDSMVPGGNTYHDIGLVWGARLLSPTGLFAADNAATPEGGEIQRHLIFMTDGDTVTSNTNLTAHGVPWWDRRQTNPASAPDDELLAANVNARTAALCTAIKNRNITLWVISFGSGVSTDAQTALQNCASTGRFYNATSSAQLISQFQQIAGNISQLRLTN